MVMVCYGPKLRLTLGLIYAFNGSYHGFNIWLWVLSCFINVCQTYDLRTEAHGVLQEGKAEPVFERAVKQLPFAARIWAAYAEWSEMQVGNRCSTGGDIFSWQNGLVTAGICWLLGGFLVLGINLCLKLYQDSWGDDVGV